MNVKITRKINKKFAAIAFLSLYSAGMTVYGSYTAGITLKHYAVASYDSFIVSQAKGRVQAEEVTKEVYVYDADKAAAVVSEAAKTGAKAGADDSIKQNLGKK